MTQLLIMHALAALHVSHGPQGVVLWVQPPHVAAGVAFVRDGVTAWFGVR